jgi:hypothetical protein
MFEENYRQDQKLKRENKRLNDKKRKPVYKNKEPEIIEEKTIKGFVLQLVQTEGGSFKVTSPFFKKGCYAVQRKTIEMAYSQGMYLVHCCYNYEDVKEEVLNEEGLLFIKNTALHSCHPYTENCVCEKESDSDC